MVNFKKKPRLDKSAIKEGVWVKLNDEDGEYYYSLKIKYVDPFSEVARNLERRFKQLKGKYAKHKDSALMANIHIFFETQVIDWKDFIDENGKPVPYSLEHAMAFMDDPDQYFLYLSAQQEASKIENFKADTTEEIVKNSPAESNGTKAE